MQKNSSNLDDRNMEFLKQEVLNREPLRPNEKILAWEDTSLTRNKSKGILLTDQALIKWGRKKIERFDFNMMENFKDVPADGKKVKYSYITFRYNDKHQYFNFSQDHIFRSIVKNIPQSAKEFKPLSKKAKARDNLLYLGVFVGFMVILVVFVVLIGRIPNPERFREIVRATCQETATKDIIPFKNHLGNVAIHDDTKGVISSEKVQLKEAKLVDEIDTLVCIKNSSRTIKTCEYTEFGVIKIDLIMRIWTVTVIDWNSKNVYAKGEFSGSHPGGCPPFVTLGSSGENPAVDISGEYPLLTDLGEWLLQNVDE